MANDRVYVRCKTCKEKHMVIKYYPAGSFVREVLPHAEESPTFNWMIEHGEECQGNRWFGMDLGGDCGFEFVVEGQL